KRLEHFPFAANHADVLGGGFQGMLEDKLIIFMAARDDKKIRRRRCFDTREGVRKIKDERSFCLWKSFRVCVLLTVIDDSNPKPCHRTDSGNEFRYVSATEDDQLWPAGDRLDEQFAVGESNAPGCKSPERRSNQIVKFRFRIRDGNARRIY